MNDIEALREHLFATLEGLRDKKDPMDLDRARAIAEVAGKVIESAKVEVEYIKVAGGESSFIGPESARLPDGITGRTVHRLKG